MLNAFILILLCQLAGEVAARFLPILLPGPVIGMGLMLALITFAPRLRALVRPTGQGILAHISLLFVPAGVGVVGHLAVLKGEALAIAASLIGSTLLAILAGAAAFAATSRISGAPTPEDIRTPGKSQPGTGGTP